MQWRAVDQRGHGQRFAPGRAAVARLHHPGAVGRRETRRGVPEDVERAVRPHDRARALSIQHIPRDQLRSRECRAAVARRHERDRRLDVAAVVRVEEEARPSDINPILEGTANVVVDGNPLFVVEGRGRGRWIDERRRTPSQVAANVEGAFINCYRVRRAGPVKAETGVKDVALAVECDRGIAARVVLAADEALDTRNEGSDLAPVGSRYVAGVRVAIAAPGAAAVVAVVCTRIGVAERTAGRGPDKAGPGTGDIVIRSADDTIGIVGVDGNRSFILRRGCSVLIYQDVRVHNGGAVERAGQHVGRGDRGRERRRLLLRFLLDESGEADLQAGGSLQ